MKRYIQANSTDTGLHTYVIKIWSETDSPRGGLPSALEEIYEIVETNEEDALAQAEQQFESDYKGSHQHVDAIRVIDVDPESELDDFDLIMYGDYKCSCGCGKLLGRPTNGTDGKPKEYSHCVGRVDDEEGFEWRCFTQDCWNILKRQGLPLDVIYDTYPPASEMV